MFASSTHASIGDTALCAVARDGRRTLARVRAADGTLEAIASPYTEIEGLRATGDRAVFIGAGPRQARAVIRLDVREGRFSELRAGSAAVLDEDEISVAEPLAFATGEDETAHAWYYAPLAWCRAVTCASRFWATAS